MVVCFFLVVFEVVLAVFEVSFRFVVVLEVVEDVVLSELEPEHVDGGVVGVVFFDRPPGTSGSEDGLDQATVVALPAVQHVVRQFLIH